MEVAVEGLQDTIAEGTEVPTTVFTDDSTVMNAALTYAWT